MRKLLFINASPRVNGTAHMLCNRLKQSLGGECVNLSSNKEKMEIICEKFKEADTIVIVGPCYVNAFPGTVTELLERIFEEREILKGKSMYGIVEGGMPYVHTHETALKQLKYFCQCCEMRYNGGFIITAAPVLNGQDLEKHFNTKKLVPAFQEFTESIKNDKVSPDNLYKDLEKKMSLVLTWAISKLMSKNMDKKIRSYGNDPYAASPYVTKK